MSDFEDVLVFLSRLIPETSFVRRSLSDIS